MENATSSVLAHRATLARRKHARVRVVAFAWPFAAAFAVAGARSLAAKTRETRDAAALRGSLAWWALTAALAVVDVWLLL